MNTTILYARGIGEPPGKPGMCHQVIRHLDRERFRAVEVTWPATYGPVGGNPQGESYERALAIGYEQVLDAITRSQDPVVLLGYSGGATLMGDVAAAFGRQYSGRRGHVLGVTLIADPHQPRGISPHGHGVAGHRPIDGVPAWWAYSDRDPICVTPELSPLRTLADQSAAMSLADPAAWGRDLHDRLRTARWQPSAWDWHDPIGSIRRYSDAADAVRRYIVHHTADYLGALTEQLADQITEGTR